MPQPRFCYVVLAHTGTDAVVRLVRRIHELSPTAEVLVRYGTEADLDGTALTNAGAHVLASALRTEWGGWSQVEAELESYRTVRERIDPDYYVLISGQDYPVRDLARWEEEVASLGVDAALDPMELNEHSYGYTWRIVRGPRLPRLVKKVGEAVAWRVSKLDRSPLYVNTSGRPNDDRWWVGVRRRGELGVPEKAATWKVMSRAAVDAVLASVREEPEERDFVASCKCPDELYVPTALRSRPDLVVGHRRVSFTRFAPDASNPDWLTVDLVREAAATEAAFARKLAPHTDPAVRRAADEAARAH